MERATYSQGQGSSAFGINKEQSRDRSHDLNSSISQGRVQRLGSCVADVGENGRAIERDDCKVLRLAICTRLKRRLTVNTAHLLGYHDSRGTIVGTPDPRHSETIAHTGEIVRVTGRFEFHLVYNARVVKVPGANDGMSSQATHGLEPLGVPAVLHEPTRRLRTEEDASHEEEGWDEGGTELEAPSNATSVFDYYIGAEAQEDTYGR